VHDIYQYVLHTQHGSNAACDRLLRGVAPAHAPAAPTALIFGFKRRNISIENLLRNSVGFPLTASQLWTEFFMSHFNFVAL
jgi:hypothetical protein